MNILAAPVVKVHISSVHRAEFALSNTARKATCLRTKCWWTEGYIMAQYMSLPFKLAHIFSLTIVLAC